MKKGCFIKFIIGLTIITAAILYILQNYFNEFILNPGREFIKDQVISSLDDDMKNVKNSIQKDSLKILLTAFINEELDSTKEFSNRHFDWLQETVEEVSRDSLINTNELKQIEQLLNLKKLNERPEKN
jgi:hypothetical protein